MTKPSGLTHETPAQRIKRLRSDPEFEALRIAGVRQSLSAETKQKTDEAARQLFARISGLPPEERNAIVAKAPARVQKQLVWVEYLMRPWTIR